MKISVSIPEDDVAFLDDYASANGIGSRSSAVRRAIGMLRASELSQHYEAAFVEWEQSDEAALWDSASGDGLVLG